MRKPTIDVDYICLLSLCSVDDTFAVLAHGQPLDCLKSASSTEVRTNSVDIVDNTDMRVRAFKTKNKMLRSGPERLECPEQTTHLPWLDNICMGHKSIFEQYHYAKQTYKTHPSAQEAIAWMDHEPDLQCFFRNIRTQRWVGVSISGNHR